MLLRHGLSLASAISQSKSQSAMYKCICYNEMYKDTQKGANLSLQIMQFILKNICNCLNILY